YYRGFSQPQWISLILMLAVALAELSGLLPFHAWHICATVLLSLTMGAISVKRHLQKTAKYQILHARHIREVAEAMKLASRYEAADTDGFDRGICLGCTSLGIQISAGEIRDEAGTRQHYAISYRYGAMTEGAARILAKLIFQLKRASGSAEFI